MSDSATTLDSLSTNTAGNETRVNELADALSPSSLFGRRASTTTGLTWGYYGGRWGGTAIAHGTVTLTNATQYVVVARSGGALSVSTATTNWNDPANYLRCYKIVATGGAVTSYEDHRAGALGAVTGAALGRRSIWIAAREMTPSASGGCAALATIASAANQPDIQTLDFDTTTQEFAQFSINMPKRWNLGTVTFVPVWSHAATATNFGVVWQLQGVAVSDDDTIAVAYGTAQTSTDTGGTTNDLYRGPESSAITISGTPAAQDVVFFRVARVPANGSDTLAIDARLHGIMLHVTHSAESDL